MKPFETMLVGTSATIAAAGNEILSAAIADDLCNTGGVRWTALGARQRSFDRGCFSPGPDLQATRAVAREQPGA
ncbi:hypothetical protein FHX08_005236 [Rhizobium sp. BK529]|uniref:hypothetical protein n=1 Tax=Rhizobium sp. BK529 TaxID=2586983 RepID=UPI0016114C43|nr:hypothetical protein [Rhizobium sp. BK529]MBB3594826.1 hypothetical protein [Rhizobium sp. BK529]